ncbi:MAG: YfhO family protein [Erysipelotrichaceae bacterium]|nr:YfhO family protein [Erysipelotrichaceae bacterium]
MNKIKEKIIETYNKIKSNEKVRAFCLIYFLGLLSFCIVAARNHFTIPMGGDYTLQTYAFYSQGYYRVWNFIKTGEFPLFDFTNYLGANYLGTQSFYYAYSPLFYLLCLWPEKFLYQGIFFHMVFKFAVGGFFMYLLLRKYFHVSYKMSWIGGFIYAYSGWSLFYLWFHFGDAMAFFPLFIIGIEKCLKERKGGILTLGLFLCGMSSYFFLVNYCLFGILYALYRWVYIYGINSKKGYSAKVRFGVLLQGVLYCAAGLILCGICLLPSLHVAMSASRTQTSSQYLTSLLQTIFLYDNDAEKIILFKFRPFKDIFSLTNFKDINRILFVWSERSYAGMKVTPMENIGYILSNWIYMNTNCWDNIMFDNKNLDNTLGGFFISTPLTMLLIPSIARTIRRKRPWEIFGVCMCLILPFLPITANAAFAFTSLYGRWQIWLVLIGIMYIIPTLDRFEDSDRKWVTISLIVNYTIAIVVYLMSKQVGKLPTSDVFNIFGLKVPGFILLSFIELLVMLLVWVIYRFKIFKAALIKNLMTMIVVIEIGTSIVVTVENKGYWKWDSFYLSQPQYEELTTLIDDMKEDDPSFYRIMNTESTRSIMNLPASLNYNGASCFNSTYDFELDYFKYRSRMSYGPSLTSWSMGNHEKRYWLDQYIGTKYYIIDKKDANNDNSEFYRDLTEKYDGRTSMDEKRQEYRLNLPWNYELYKEYEYYDVYINNNFNGIGYMVDRYIDSSTAGRYSPATYYEEMYTTTAIIEDEDVQICKDNNILYTNGIDKKTNTFKQSNWDLYYSPRKDVSKTEKREEYKITSSKFTKSEIEKYIKAYEGKLHGRWVDKGYYGDQLILKLKDGKEKLASEASDDNMCYVSLFFRMGPRALISFYNGDTLVTQDAHHNSGTLNGYRSEFKDQRGFYLNQPVDKIVIEYIVDATFSQAFDSSSIPFIDAEYLYQSDIEQMEEKISENLLKDVTYKNNKFTFKSTSEKKQIAVTNIPFDDGWTLKTNGKKQDIFKVNGGFVGFLVQEGEYEYSLSYFTPKLKEGIAMTTGGLIFFIVLWFVYKNKKISILKIEEQIEKVHLDKMEKEEEKEMKTFEENWKTIKDKIKNFLKK